MCVGFNVCKYVLYVHNTNPEATTAPNIYCNPTVDRRRLSTETAIRDNGHRKRNATAAVTAPVNHLEHYEIDTGEMETEDRFFYKWQ